MRNFASLILTVSLTATSGLAAPSSSSINLYHDYLRRVETTIDRTRSLGFEPAEITQIETSIHSKPRVTENDSFVPYFEMLGRIAQSFESFGYDESEKQILKALIEAQPVQTGRVNASSYISMLRGFDTRIERLKSFGFDQNELEVLSILSQAGVPATQVSKRAYKEAYIAWSQVLEKQEASFASFGIEAGEAAVLKNLRQIEPLTGSGAPSTDPSQGDSPDQQKVLRVCGKDFLTKKYLHSKNRVLVLENNNELSELDHSSCRIRFLADHVAAFETVENLGILAFRKPGSVFHVYANGDVFQLSLGDMNTNENDTEGLIWTRDSEAQQRFTSSAAAQIKKQGSSSGARFRYKTDWRPL